MGIDHASDFSQAEFRYLLCAGKQSRAVAEHEVGRRPAVSMGHKSHFCCDWVTEQVDNLVPQVIWAYQPAVTCFYGVGKRTPAVFPDPDCSQAFVVIDKVLAVFLRSVQYEMEVVIHEAVGDNNHTTGRTFTQLVTYRNAIDSGYEFFFRGVKYVSFKAVGTEMVVLFHAGKFIRNLDLAKDLRQTYTKFYVSGFERVILEFVPTTFTPNIVVW